MPRIRSPLPLLLLAVLGLCAPPARADKLHLRDGRVLEGTVEEEEPGRVRVRMRLGSVWVLRADILRIEKEPAPREEFERRKAAIAEGAAAAWAELGIFCTGHELWAEAEDCFLRALKADPSLAGARERLDAIRAARAVEALLSASTDAQTLERTAALVLLEEPGRRAAEEAIARRTCALRGFAADPGPVRARIASEFRLARDDLRSTVLNGELYTDTAERTRERVAGLVRRVRSLAADPGGPEALRTHMRLGLLLDESERLRAALLAFRDPPKDPLEDAARAAAEVAAAVRAEDFLAAANPFRAANRAVGEANGKEAVALGLSEAEREGALAVNEYRELLGLKALRIDASLCRAAAGHSAAMSERGFFSHESPLPGRKTPYARIRKEGYEFRVAGENVARKEGGLGAREAVDAWIASPGHHRNLLVPDFEDAGIGVRGIYWTLDLGRRAAKD
jgi:uncharacterized protein YkwD